MKVAKAYLKHLRFLEAASEHKPEQIAEETGVVEIKEYLLK